MDDSSEAGLALDNGIGDTHLAAESRQEDDQLNRVNIVGDEDKRSLLVLDQANNVVETILDSIRLLADILLLLALLNGGSLLKETLLLLGLGLRTVLVQELESLGGGVAVENVLELGDRRRHLEAHVDDLALALKADILGPLHHTGEVATGLDVLADAEVARLLLEERVLNQNQHPRGSSQSRDFGIKRSFTHLGGLLRARLGRTEGGRGGLLSGLGRLSLRKKTSANVFH